MDLDLSGKRALVCGGSQGIGLAAAQELADLGAEITLFARSESALNEALSTLSKNHNQEHSILVADFFNTKQVQEVAVTQVDYNILVNNTGGPPGGLAIDADVEEYRIAFNAHLINNQVITQAVVPYMKSSGYGRIINIISTSVKAPLAGLGVSNTIRGAVNSWSKTLSNELGQYGITVNNVLPGATKTARLDSIISNKATKTNSDPNLVEEQMMAEIPAKRFGSPNEIGAVVAFLASPAAGYINGISIAVDGGRTGCF